MNSINRCAFTLIAKQPMVDWVKKIEEESFINSSNVNDDPNIYLVPESDYTYEYTEWIKKNYRIILENELSEWCTDEKKWPKNLSYELFNQFYDFKISEVIYDLGDDDIEKDD
jgi:hypothetical protein